jgi:hypothetical protein
MICGDTMEKHIENSLPKKEKEPSAKMDKRRCWEKEKQMKFFADIHRKTFEVQERKLELAEGKERSSAKEYKLKAKEVEATLLIEENGIMMADLTSLDPERRD